MTFSIFWLYWLNSFCFPTTDTTQLSYIGREVSTVQTGKKIVHLEIVEHRIGVALNYKISLLYFIANNNQSQGNFQQRPVTLFNAIEDKGLLLNVFNFTMGSIQKIEYFLILLATM